MTSIHHDHAHPHRRRRSALVSLLVVVIALAGALLLPSPAHAVAGTGTGVGFMSSDGWWIGSWSLADGSRGFCIDLGGRAPTGHELEPTDAASLGRFSDDDRARLAYISRTWAGTEDPLTAAAAQLATWTITGLNGHALESLAARAGARAGEVLQRSSAMLAELGGPSGASRSVAARLAIDRDDSGASTLVAALDVDYLSGSGTAPPDAFDGVATVQGAVFADGSHEHRVRNGVSYPLTPEDGAAVVELKASVTFADLPFGAAATVAHAEPGVQSVLTASPGRASAQAEVSMQRPSSLPFQPVVATKASDTVAVTGATVHDVLQVGVGTGHGVASEWGVYGDDGGPYTPIPIVVRSRLLGPFGSPSVASDQAPADAPVVCEVTTTIDHGPGEYSTPPCTLPNAGYFVWVETISPDDTAPEQGRSRVRSWTSRFGEASETVLVSAPPAHPSAPADRLAETGSSDGQARIAAGLAATSATLFGISALCARWARRTARRLPRRGAR
ncbi:hypothetical protein [Humibacter sp.]|uniref:hypothetical protein n=1 Tax=Humibacter sp. TaxID=1940291 RepID=UPI003F7E95FF